MSNLAENIETYINLVKSNDPLDFTTLYNYLLFFDELMEGCKDRKVLVNLVGSYHTALQSPQCITHHETDTLEIDGLPPESQRLYEFILIDLAYRTIRVNNPLILHTLTNYLHELGCYNDCVTFEALFNKLWFDDGLRYFDRVRLRNEVMDVFAAKRIYNSQSHFEVAEAHRTNFGNFIKRLETLEFATNGVRDRNVYTLLKYELNQLIYCGG